MQMLGELLFCQSRT